MQDVEIFADLVQKLARDVSDEIAALSPEDLAWQPDPEANSIGVTVWHFSRWLDVLVVQVLENRPAEQEQWHTHGWSERTSYDPRGIGYRGLGVLTGYSQPEVAAVPTLRAEALLSYLDQVTDALRQQLLGMSPGALYQPAPGPGGKRSAYEWLTTLLMGCFGHVGEIEALKAMRARALQRVS